MRPGGVVYRTFYCKKWEHHRKTVLDTVSSSCWKTDIAGLRYHQIASRPMRHLWLVHIFFSAFRVDRVTRSSAFCFFVSRSSFAYGPSANKSLEAVVIALAAVGFVPPSFSLDEIIRLHACNSALYRSLVNAHTLGNCFFAWERKVFGPPPMPHDMEKDIDAGRV